MNKITKKYNTLGAFGTIIWLIQASSTRLLLLIRNFLFDHSSVFPCTGIKYTATSTKKRIFILAGVPYYDIGGGQRSAQLAKTFNSMGLEVHYLFRQHSSEKKIHRIPLPVAIHKSIHQTHIKKYHSIIHASDIVILEVPEQKFLPFIMIAKSHGAKIVYENIDDWETPIGTAFQKQSALQDILQSSDLLVGTANSLVSQLQSYLKKFNITNKRILLLPNAVDALLFNPTQKYPQPPDLAIGTKTLIYYGTLSGNWFNWQIIFKIARKFPNYTINLIGDASLISQKITSAPFNIHFLGLKKQSKLPAYLAHSDIALLPFKPSKLTTAISPLKIFEYIAMNKLVISTKLPDIIDYPNVLLGDTPASWEKILATKISKTKPNQELTKQFISKHTWQNRCNQILSSFSAKPY